MSDEKQAAPAAEKVLIFHIGKGHGPMETADGILRPGASLEVSEALAAKLTGAYKHVKLAKDVIPGGAADPKVAAENVALKAEIAKLAKQLEDLKSKDVKAEAPAAAEPQPEAAAAVAEAPAKKAKK